MLPAKRGQHENVKTILTGREGNGARQRRGELGGVDEDGIGEGPSIVEPCPPMNSTNPATLTHFVTTSCDDSKEVAKGGKRKMGERLTARFYHVNSLESVEVEPPSWGINR